MEKNGMVTAAVWGIFIGIGIAFAGLTLSNAIYKARLADRYVSVKGLAEREVPADLVIWPVTFKEAGDDLMELKARIDVRRETIAAFLEGAGFKRSEVSYSAPRITDTQAESDHEGGSRPKFRYVAQATVTLRSQDVASVKKAIEKSGELVGQGIVLGAEDWHGRTEFLFTGLNHIKPEMIETATMSAREAAEKFAKDSGSTVGKIRTATQGLFTITNRDENSPDLKLVRVVTTVEYYLVDQ
jgi:uncharacterized protein